MITLKTKELKEALDCIKPIVKQHAVIPILECIEMSFDFYNDLYTLSVTGSNLETTIVRSLFYETETPKKQNICINFKDLYDITKLISDEKINLIVNDNNIIIKTYNGEVNLPLETSDTFPLNKTFKNIIYDFSVDSCMLSNIINKSIKLASKDELRPTMCGINIKSLSDDMGVIYSTDGHVLISHNIPITNNKEKLDLIFNMSLCNILKDMCKSDKEFVIKSDMKYIEIETSNGFIYSQLIEGKYPNIKGVIPDYNNSNIKLTVSASNLLNSINQSYTCASKASGLIKLKIKDNNIVVQAHDIDFAKSAKFNIQCNSITENNDIEIGYNYNKLNLLLSNFNKDEMITLYISENTKPTIFVGENEDMLHLIMPLLLVN